MQRSDNSCGIVLHNSLNSTDSGRPWIFGVARGEFSGQFQKAFAVSCVLRVFMFGCLHWEALEVQGMTSFRLLQTNSCLTLMDCFQLRNANIRSENQHPLCMEIIIIVSLLMCSSAQLERSFLAHNHIIVCQCCPSDTFFVCQPNR